jgi:hypothetical protein
MSWEWLLGILPLLVLLACPVMMIWMMRGGGMSRNENGKEPASGGADEAGDPEAELAELRARLARLEVERTAEPEEAWR